MPARLRRYNFCDVVHLQSGSAFLTEENYYHGHTSWIDVCFHSYIVVPDPSLVIQDRAKMQLSKLHIALISGIIFGVLLFCTFIALIVRKLCIPKVRH